MRPSYVASRHIGSSRRRLRRRSSWVSAMPRLRLARSESSGAHAGSMPKARQKRNHSSLPVGPRSCGTVTTCTRSGGSLAPQLSSTLGRSMALRNHVWPRSTLVEEAVEGPLATLLDALLPGGRELAAEVAGGVDDVDLAALEVVHDPGDLVRLGRREDLVADDDGAAGAADALDHRLPRALRVTRGAAPVLLEQVEGRAEVEEVGVDEPVLGRDRHPVVRQRRLVEHQPVLQVGRPRLRGADVEVDDATHGLILPARVRRRWDWGARAARPSTRWSPPPRRGRRRARCRGR